MKKVKITLLLMVAVVTATFAQIPYKNPIAVQNNTYSSSISNSFLKKIKDIKSSSAKASASNYWINYGDALSNTIFTGITDPTNTSNTLGGWPIWPDSLAVIVPSAAPNTPFNWWTHGYSDFFSPSSGLIGQYAKSSLGITNGDLFFNRNCSYNIDSIRVFFGYFQHVTSNDSLYIYVMPYNSSAISAGSYTFTNDTTTHFKIISYNYAANQPQGTVTKYGFALNAADSNGVRTFPVNLNIPASTGTGRFGNSIGVAFRYKPNQAYSLGDTLENNANLNSNTHKLNGLNLLCYEEATGATMGANVVDKSYNYGNIVTTTERYNIGGSSAGWNGQYIPTLAYTAPFYPEHPYIDYHLNFEGSAFKYIKSSAKVTFTDLSNFTPTAWAWDFGDQNSDIVQNPVHTYAAKGTYSVCLTATAGSKSYTSCQKVSITSVGINDVNNFTLGQLYPNPVVAGNDINLPIELNASSNVAHIKVSNVIGQTVAESTQEVSNKVVFNTTNLKSGIYIYSVEIGGQKATGKFTVVE